ncbi:MAG: TldD/PmbA family protein [Asgard group archaeon]|nr:TldD/PmbA family protein [Asgard group archaeon]
MELGEYAVKKAIDLGMDEAEAYISRIKKINIQFDSEIQNIITTESIGIGLRVALGKQLAMQASSILTEQEVDSMVEKVVKIAKVSPEDPNWQYFNKKFGKTEVSGIFDKKIAEFDYDKMTDKVFSGINKVSENDRKVLITEGKFTATSGEIRIFNSYDNSLKNDYTVNSGYIYAKAIKGGESTGAEGQIARSWDGFNLEDIADKAADKSLRYVGSKPIESMTLPVIINNRLFANIFGFMIGFNITADNILQGRSTFATKMDQQISTEEISLVDDGTLKGGIGTRPFDTDGVSTQKTEIISKGVLKNFLYDNYYSLKANVKPTGNAHRNYWSIPSPTINNLILNSGSTSLEEMIKGTKKGLFIENTIGEWLSNPTNGDLNATVTHGYLIENGELTKPVSNVVIGGNIFDILMNKIEILGNDVNNNNKVYSPSVKISEMSIAGK